MSLIRFEVRSAAALVGSLLALSCTGMLSSEGEGPGAGPPLPGNPGGGTTGVAGPEGTGSTLHCDPAATTYPAKRLWRLTGAQYKSTLQAALPVQVAATPFDAINAGDRFSNLSDSYTMNDFEFRQSMEISEELSLSAVSAWRNDPASCLSGAGAFADCAMSLLEGAAGTLLRHPLRAEDVPYYRSLIVDNAPVLGEDDALALALQRMLVSIRFVFRNELGRGNPESNGTVQLSSYEVAEAIAYSLTDAPPDAELSAAARAGQLSTVSEISSHLQRLLAAVAERPSAVRFFREYTRYPHATEVFKDAGDFPFHQPQALVDDTDLWVKTLLTSNGRSGFLKAFLTAPTASISKDTAPSYANLDDGSVPTVADASTLHTFAPGQRSGFLTQPSFLVAFSTSTENETVRRGRFMVETLLCGSVPEVPIGVVPTLPEAPDATMRERLAAHREVGASCPTCHTQMDPLGLALENYDHLGRFRSTQHGKPIDAAGQLTGAGSADGPFVDVTQLASSLAASEVVAQCFVRHSFRYWMGRTETPGDGCSVTAAYQTFSSGAENYVELLAALFTSDAFLKRSTVH